MLNTLQKQVEKIMKVGDLVLCNYQPRAAGVDKDTGACIEMKYKIKGEFGIITSFNNSGSCTILFPRYGYKHMLAKSCVEVVSESW